MEYKTKQKEIIIKILQDNNELSMNAKEILAKLGSRVSKATLYRALERLEEENKIRRFYNEVTSSYEYQYLDANDKCSSHLHLKCNSCGKLFHLHCEESDSFLSHIAHDHNFFVSQNETMIYGICKSCSIVKRG